MKNFRLIKILIGGLLFSIGNFTYDNSLLTISIFLTAYVIVGGDVLIKAIGNILSGEVFDENFLMGLATIVAIIIGEYPEAVAVMLFYQVGELLQSYAVNKSRKSISDLMDIRPDYANVKRGDTVETVSPDDVKIGEHIIVKPGEKIPIDGCIVNGNAVLDTVALTGESIPREVFKGEEVLSGCINLNGLLTVEVTKEFSESTVSKILELVENASSKKSNSENFITKFARYYTPTVVVLAILLAVLPPFLISGESYNDWIYRALTFLVISCPCALVISIPLSFFGGIGGASRSGVLIKGSNYLEALSKTEIMVFDKTGTLTKGIFEINEIKSVSLSDNDIIEIAAIAESYSSHPISLTLKKAYGKEIDNSRLKDINEKAGYGVVAMVDGKRVSVGNDKLMKELEIEYENVEKTGTVVYLAIDGKYEGYILIADELKNDSKNTIKELKKLGIIKNVMLTGDKKSVGDKVASELAMDEVYSELLPSDKVTWLEKLQNEKSSKGKLVFVGDGINDAPVLAMADIGIAMGGLGSDAAIEAADIVIMNDEPSKLCTAIRISKKTLQIVKQNIFLALIVKCLVLALGAGGVATMWEAVFADVGVTVLAIFNSMRVLKYRSNIDVS